LINIFHRPMISIRTITDQADMANGENVGNGVL